MLELDIRLTLVQHGLTNEEIEEVVKNHGTDALYLILSVLQNGLTKNFIFEVLTVFGKVVLELILKLLYKRKLAKTSSSSTFLSEEEVDDVLREILHHIKV